MLIAMPCLTPNPAENYRIHLCYGTAAVAVAVVVAVAAVAAAAAAAG